MAKPNFFIVGSFKAGTTSWFRWLAAHPEIAMCRLKEPHYFVPNRPERPQVVASEKAYLALFGEGKVVGEASAFYFTTPESPALIHAFNADAKILVCLRHPVEVAYAFYYEQCFLGRESRPFAEAWPDYAAVVAAWPLCLARWREHFAQVKVVLLEDVAKDAAGQYREVCEFLGVDTKFLPDLRAHNPAKALPAQWRAGLQSSPVVVALVRLLYRVPAVAVAIDRVRAARVVYAPRPAMDEGVRSALLATLAPTVDAMEAALQRGLSGWRV